MKATRTKKAPKVHVRKLSKNGKRRGGKKTMKPKKVMRVSKTGKRKGGMPPRRSTRKKIVTKKESTPEPNPEAAPVPEPEKMPSPSPPPAQEIIEEGPRSPSPEPETTLARRSPTPDYSPPKSPSVMLGPMPSPSPPPAQEIIEERPRSPSPEPTPEADKAREQLRDQLRKIQPMFRDHFLKSDAEKDDEFKEFQRKQKAATERLRRDTDVARQTTWMGYQWAIKSPEEKEAIRQDFLRKQREAKALSGQ